MEYMLEQNVYFIYMEHSNKKDISKLQIKKGKIIEVMENQNYGIEFDNNSKKNIVVRNGVNIFDDKNNCICSAINLELNKITQCKQKIEVYTNKIKNISNNIINLENLLFKNVSTTNNIEKLTINDADKLEGAKPYKFVFCSKEYKVKTQKDMLSKLFEILYEINPSKFSDLAENDFMLNDRTIYVSYNKKMLRVPYQLKKSKIFIETNLNSKTKLYFIESMLKKYNIEPDKFYFYVK